MSIFVSIKAINGDRSVVLVACSAVKWIAPPETKRVSNFICWTLLVWYRRWFRRLSVKLCDCDGHKLIFGSDEENCLWEIASPTNFIRFAEKFCQHCLVMADWVPSIECCVDKFPTFDTAADTWVEATELNVPPSECVIYIKHILSLLRNNLAAGQVGWTHNNCESANHVLQQPTNWWPQHLPELVDKLHALVESQYIDCVVEAISFFIQWIRNNGWLLTSTDGSVQVPTMPGGGKKPHQQKRMKAERTRAVNANKKLKVLENDPDTDYDI